MEFVDRLKEFSQRITNLKSNLKTEEATKTSLVLPFFNLLGYDVFNPLEFVPEFIADTGTKKGEKVDYAILKNKEPIIIVEVKSCDSDLNSRHINQLYRYFTVTKARFAILTNGIVYQFYSDLEEPNKMDSIPFLTVDLLNLNNKVCEELMRFQKSNFSEKGILDSASELKYTLMVKQAIIDQINSPSDQFIKAIVSKDIYNGVKTQAILDKFRDIIKVSFQEYINEVMNERFKNMLISGKTGNNTDNQELENSVDLSAEETEVFNYIKSLVKSNAKVSYAKTTKYASLLLNNNSRKWVCRLYIR